MQILYHQKIAAGLMILSGLTHPSQLLIYGTGPDIRGPALFGVLYLLVGLGLLTRYRAALWVGVVLPLLGGLGSIYRLVALEPTAFTLFHTIIDFVVVMLCIRVLFATGEKSNG
ncbi:MAG: hypothetical protein O7F73_14450 [Gammaproteobacteria bacterium]|nr:hypothetical protein [Gammaproteobacteria bacterium]